MTREERKEAIAYIKKYRELDEKLYQTAPFNSVAKNALTKCLGYWDVAIQSLEQKPCKDAISRQVALDLCERFNGCVPYSVLSSYDMLPPVTVEPEIGHWTRELIRNDKGGCIGAKMICSNCGKDNKHDEHMSYCPNCGAKMKSEEL